MFFERNNKIDDDVFETRQSDKKNINLKLPLIILGCIIFLIIIILLINKLFNKKQIVYDDKLYYINLIGDKEITLYVGDTFVEPGYTGTDDIGNDLTKEVVISDNIDNNTIGNYKVSYTLGNITKERNVKVIEKPVGATYIYLYGDVNTFLYVGDVYQEKGYEVIDTFEGSKLKDKVIVNSNVDTSHEGIYKIIYSVVNTSGITVSKERTVIVTDRNISLLPSITDITNSNVTINVYVKDELFDYLILPNNKKVTERISTYEVSSNGTYTFTMYNNNGDKTEKKITINNIDREVPSGSCTGSYSNGISNINIKANDNNGISRYILNGTTYTTNNIKVNEELKNVTITIYDVAGNSKNISCNLEDKNQQLSSSINSSSQSPTSSVRPSSSIKSSSKSSTSSVRPSSSIKSSSSRPSNSSIAGGGSGNIANISPDYPPKYTTANISVNYYKNFSFWAYIPNNVSKNMPIIMYMPGLGERGNDYASNSSLAISYGPIHEIYKYHYSYNAIIIHVQVPSGQKVYSYVGSYVELLNKIANEFNANKNKISVIGFSHGCYGILTLVPQYQRYFSSAVMIGCGDSASGGMNSYANSFVYTPTWAFVGGHSDGFSSMPGFVSQINSLGGNAKYTYIEGGVHNLISDNYSILRDSKYNVINWMISQSR